MRGLNALAWRGLRARPLRSVLTMSASPSGVAVLFAGLATNAGIEASVDRTVAGLVGEADLRVARSGRRGLAPRDRRAPSRRRPGVAVAAPTFERRTYLGLDLLGPGDALPAPVTVVGIDPEAEPRLHDLTLRAGAPLVRPDEPSALISATLAREDGLIVGSELTDPGTRGADRGARHRHPGRRRTVGRRIRSGRRRAARARPRPRSPDAGISRVDIGLADGADVTAGHARPRGVAARPAVRALVAARPRGRDARLDR